MRHLIRRFVAWLRRTAVTEDDKGNLFWAMLLESLADRLDP